MESPEAFEANAVKFNEMLKKLKSALGAETEVSFDAGDQRELGVNRRRLVAEGGAEETIADVYGFNPEKKYMIDFGMVKTMIKHFNSVRKNIGDDEPV